MQMILLDQDILCIASSAEPLDILEALHLFPHQYQACICKKKKSKSLSVSVQNLSRLILWENGDYILICMIPFEQQDFHMHNGSHVLTSRRRAGTPGF